MFTSIQSNKKFIIKYTKAHLYHNLGLMLSLYYIIFEKVSSVLTG